MNATSAQRSANLARRNEQICIAFRARYTAQPRPRKFTREYVIGQLANEFFLSVARIEDIIYGHTH